MTDWDEILALGDRLAEAVEDEHWRRHDPRVGAYATCRATACVAARAWQAAPSVIAARGHADEAHGREMTT